MLEENNEAKMSLRVCRVLCWSFVKDLLALTFSSQFSLSQGLSRQTVASLYRHQSSSGATGQAINHRQPCFPGCWPKDLECPARGCKIFPVWVPLSLPAQNVSFEEVFSGHHLLLLRLTHLSTVHYCKVPLKTSLMRQRHSNPYFYNNKKIIIIWYWLHLVF